MGIAKKGGYIEKFLKKADKALQEGVKKADEVLDDAVELGAMTAKQASKTSKELRNQAKKERKALQKRGLEKINEGISAAKNVASNTKEDLEILKKLGKLRDNGIITEKEFQSKKKKILDRI
jgi:polyhydroxyalkanoate synthesis regulator phasin